jgi:DNA-binding transcriptional LysR family regulator
MRGFDLGQLDSFRQVIALGSFSAAADKLGLSQPAVSLQIRQLERRLGTSLIERVGRRARATAAGAELLDHAGRIEAAVAGALEAMERHATGAMGRVRIGTGATACIFLLPPILRDLRRRHPTLEITVSTGNTSDMIKAIEDNLLDIGLVSLPASGRSLSIEPLLEDEFMVIAPPGSDLPARVSAQLLAQMPVLLFEPGGNTRRIADEWFGRAGVSLRPIMSLGSVEAIKELVGAGLGCAVLPGMAVRGLRDNLEARPLAPRLHRTLALVMRKDKPLHRGLRETLKALQALGGAS